MPRAYERLQFIFLIVSIGMFFACLTVDAFDGVSSWFIFLGGWTLLHKGWPYIIWLANPILVLCWALAPIFVSLSEINLSPRQSRFFKGVIVCLTLANLALALSFLLPLEVVTNPKSGAALPVKNYQSGYWLWIASIGCMAISGLLVRPRSNPDAVD